MAGGRAGSSIAILGAGYVGTELATLALAKGWRVAALTRNRIRAEALRAIGCERVVERDIALDDGWQNEMGAPFDFVANCTSPGGGGIDGYRHSCVAGSESIGRWLATMPPGRIVHTSSTGVYPQGGGVRLDESAPTEQGEGRGGLLRSAEIAIERGATRAGWTSFVLRLAGIYGPGRHHLLDQVRAGGPLSGDPTVHLNLIHRDDICSAIVTCLEADPNMESGTFNLSDGSPSTRREVADWLAARLGVSKPVFAGVGGPSPFGRRSTPDRVIVSELFRETFGWKPSHEDFKSGYSRILNPV